MNWKAGDIPGLVEASRGMCCQIDLGLALQDDWPSRYERDSWLAICHAVREAAGFQHAKIKGEDEGGVYSPVLLELHAAVRAMCEDRDEGVAPGRKAWPELLQRQWKRICLGLSRVHDHQ